MGAAELLFAQERLRREAPEWCGRASTRAWKIGRGERANTASPIIAARTPAANTHSRRVRARHLTPARSNPAQDTTGPPRINHLSLKCQRWWPRLRLLHLDWAPASSSLALAFSASSLVALSSNGLRRAVDQVLGLLEAQARELRTSLMTWIFLSPAAVQDHVELVLLLGCLGRPRRRRRRPRRRPRPGPRPSPRTPLRTP